MQKKYLTVTFIFDEVCCPWLRPFTPRKPAPQGIDRRGLCDSISVDQRLDRRLPVVVHYKIIDGVIVEYDLLATGNIYEY